MASIILFCPKMQEKQISEKKKKHFKKIIIKHSKTSKKINKYIGEKFSWELMAFSIVTPVHTK